ncbi:MAG: Mov34/MPN/PAD-1 family protein [Deltaproteobacteria bacterium]|nr:Mov34/MPN/PAD-1 family protein [Deltaproteobacteria bacterium]
MIRFGPGIADALRGRARGLHERCGLLFGQRTGSVVSVSRLEEVTNVRRSRSRFAFPPEVLLAHAGDPAWVGVWHSHPGGPAALSAHDRAGAAAWPHLLQVLLVPPHELLVFDSAERGLSPLSWTQESSPCVIESAGP